MDTSELSDRIALRDLACRYASAVDKVDLERLGDVFCEDAELSLPYRQETHNGRAAIVKVIGQIDDFFDATFHAVHNQLIELQGDTASGETYCIALHFSSRDGGRQRYDMCIRYQDQMRRENGVWRFARRELQVDWEHTWELGVGAAVPLG